MNNRELDNQKKVGIIGWISLIALVVLFSGVFTNSETFLKALDFSNLNGSFGKIASNLDFRGKGGVGAKEGMIYGLSLIPTVMLAMGFIDVIEAKGGLIAAEKLFRPILKPILGIPGTAGISFIASFTSSDVASVMTKELYESGLMSDNQRSIYLSYQYAGSALIANTISTQAPLLPISLLALGPILVILFLLKVFGANLMRVYLSFYCDNRGNRYE